MSKISPYSNESEISDIDHADFMKKLAARRAIALPRKRKQPVKSGVPARAHGH
jgi:hypothetical protein